MTELRPSTVTSSLRIMLPAYVAHAGLCAALYGLNPGGLVWGRPAIAAIEWIAPMPVWGLVLAFWAGLLATAMLTHNRLLGRWALIGYGITNVLWTIGYVAGVVVDKDASLIAPVHTALAATACFASNTSLRREEYVR